jgi:hypothetical protein
MASKLAERKGRTMRSAQMTPTSSEGGAPQNSATARRETAETINPSDDRKDVPARDQSHARREQICRKLPAKLAPKRPGDDITHAARRKGFKHSSQNMAERRAKPGTEPRAERHVTR